MSHDPPCGSGGQVNSEKREGQLSLISQEFHYCDSTLSEYSPFDKTTMASSPG